MAASPTSRAISVIGIAALSFILIASPVMARGGEGSRDNEGDNRNILTEVEGTGQGNSSSEATLKRDESANPDNSHGADHPLLVAASQEAELKLRVTDAQEIKKARLTQAKLKACQNRQSAIIQHAKDSTKTASSIEAKFASIATKVEAFKLSKQIDVENYDTLLADIVAKKTEVDTAVAEANVQMTDFSCDSDGPKAELQLFVSKMDMVRQAIKDYRDSIKNLILAVRQANGQNRQSSPSATPKGDN